MPISLKHAFVSAIPDGPDTTLVRPSNWNDEHVLTQATNRLLGRLTAGTGAVEELTSAQVISWLNLTAADIDYVAGGNIAATNVQAALQELDTEKLALSGGTITGNLTVNGTTAFNSTPTVSSNAMWHAGNFASAAEIRANTSSVGPPSVNNSWTALNAVALTDAATIAVDMNLGINFTVTLAGNRTLGAPTNAKQGQTGTIRILQDGTGSRTLAYNTNWKFANGSVPTLTTTANAVDYLTYYVHSATEIWASLTKNVRNP